MPSSAFQRPVESDPEVDFIAALSTNEASPTANLVLPTRDAFWFIRAINIIATQNLAYEFQFYSSAQNMDGTFSGDKFIGVWQFSAMTGTAPASPGYQVEVTDGSPGDNFFHYYIDGLFIPYFDGDQLEAASQASGGSYPNNAKLHVRLINRSATGKTGGAPGALQATFFVAAQGMQV